MSKNTKKFIEMFSKGYDEMCSETESMDYDELKEHRLRLDILIRHKDVAVAQMERMVEEIKKLPTYAGKHEYYWDEDLDKAFDNVKNLE